MEESYVTTLLTLPDDILYYLILDSGFISVFWSIVLSQTCKRLYCFANRAIARAKSKFGDPDSRDELRLISLRAMDQFFAAHNKRERLEAFRKLNCPWDELTLSGAAGGGHIELLKWLHIQFLNKQFEVPCWPWEVVVWNAARNGHVNILEWTTNHPKLNCSRRGLREKALTGAAQNGQIETLKWLTQDTMVSFGPTATIIAKIASSYGQISVLRWLKEKCLPPPLSGHLHFDPSAELLRSAVYNDQLNTIIYLQTEWSATTHLKFEHARIAAQKGNLDMLKHILDSMNKENAAWRYHPIPNNLNVAEDDIMFLFLRSRVERYGGCEPGVVLRDELECLWQRGCRFDLHMLHAALDAPVEIMDWIEKKIQSEWLDEDELQWCLTIPRAAALADFREMRIKGPAPPRSVTVFELRHFVLRR